MRKNSGYIFFIPKIIAIFVANMLQLPKIIKKTLSVRIGLMVVIAMALLLMASMGVMYHYSRKAVKEEATQKALQSLEGMVHNIDNILLSVEQTTGNIYFSMLPNLDKPNMMDMYARKIVETNPYVAGCAIAFEDGFLKGQQQFYYVHRDDSAGIAYASSLIVRDNTFGNKPYTEQLWFKTPIKNGRATWLNPLSDMKDADEAPIVTYCLPIYAANNNPSEDQKWRVVGVVGVDVSRSLLSDIVSESKLSLSKNSYSTLLDNDGSYIVHPFSNNLTSKSALDSKEQSAKEAAQAMVSGETGYKPFTMGNADYYVFYKPFKRVEVPGIPTTNIPWSAGIIYPEEDIFGDYNSLAYYVLAIIAIGLLLSFFASTLYTHHRLKPLLMLTEQAQRIAKGKLDEPIPDSHREDEIGRLQNNFKLMQQSLSNNIGELEQLTTKLKKHGEKLSTAYKQAQKADRMKTAFLHNMTNQMQEPAETINKDVEALIGGTTHGNTVQLAEDIQQNGTAITELLKNLLNMSDEDFRKEADHV